MMTSQNGYCHMRFFYDNVVSIYKGTPAKAGNLRVYVRHADGNEPDSNDLFSSSELTQTWTKNTASYRSEQPFQFVFEAYLSDEQSSLSLDDVSFHNCLLSNAVYKPGHRKFSP